MHMNTPMQNKTGQKKFYINCHWGHRFKNFASEKTNKSRDKLCSFTINSGLTWNNYFIYKTQQTDSRYYPRNQYRQKAL